MYESQHADTPHVLEAIMQVFPEVAVLVDWANQNMKSKTGDDSKITAHHGIILTILSEKERNIYDLNVVTRNGWRDVYIEAEEEAESESVSGSNNQALPDMQNGDVVSCVKATRMDAKTKAPSRFTEGTVTGAMENIYKYVVDAEHKNRQKDWYQFLVVQWLSHLLANVSRRQWKTLTTPSNVRRHEYEHSKDL